MAGRVIRYWRGHFIGSRLFWVEHRWAEDYTTEKRREEERDVRDSTGRQRCRVSHKLQTLQIWPEPAHQLLCERTSDSSWGFRLVSNESVSQIDSKTRLGAQTSCDLWDAAQRAFMYSVRTLLHRLHRLFAACVFAVGRRGCSEDDWLCRVCSRGQVSYLHLLAQKMLRSAPFGRSICSPNTRTTLCFSFANLSLLFSPHYSSSVPFFLLFRNSLQSKKNTQIPPRYPWYVMFSLYSIFFLF